MIGDSARPATVPRTSLAAAALAVLLAACAAVALRAGLGGPAGLDAAALGDAVGLRTGALTTAALAVTHVGRPLVMGAVVVLLAAWLWWRGRRLDAVFLGATAAVSSATFSGLKDLLDRMRPPLETRLARETSESLPSGHATVSMAVVGALVVVAWAGRGVLARLLLVAGAALWVAAVGATRVYLGVHWVTDVVAGWLVGATCLAAAVAARTWWTARAARGRCANGTVAQ